MVLFHLLFFKCTIIRPQISHIDLFSYLQTTIRPNYRVLFHLFFLCARPFDQKLVSSLIHFFYLYMTIRPKLGVTLILKFIIFLIETIVYLQSCLYISSATIMPLYFVNYIDRSTALIFRMLYPRLYEVLAKIYWYYLSTGNRTRVTRMVAQWFAHYARSAKVLVKKTRLSRPLLVGFKFCKMSDISVMINQLSRK